MDVAKESDATPSRRGWFRRNWKRMLGGLLLLLVVGAVGGYFVRFGPILFSQPYREALDFVVREPQVIAELGEPIKRRGIQDWTPSGMITGEDGNGQAQLNFSVTGPKGQAKVAITARLVQGDKEWGYPNFQVTLPGEKQLSLVDAINKTKPGDTPKFDPNAEGSKPPRTKEAPPDVDIKLDDIPMPDKK